MHIYKSREEATRAALVAQTARQTAQGRVFSPWAQRALTGTLPVKDMTRSAR